MISDELECKAFEAGQKLKNQGWTVNRSHRGGNAPRCCVATITKGTQQYERRADTYAEALWLAVQAVLDETAS